MPEYPAIDLCGDHHIHTRFCNHAQGEMEAYVQAAIDKGLQSMTFLEHLECSICYDHRTWLTPELFTEYFKEGTRLQEQYTGKIEIKIGVEVGYNPSAVEELRAMLVRFPFEHVGLSYHFYFDGSRHLNMVSRRPENINGLTAVGVDHVLNEYFTGLIQACNQIPCDKICHLDAALCYIPGLCFTEQHKALIEQLLLLMWEKNIALEVNTSGIPIRSHPYPARDIVLRAQELGIPLIAGSDAHQPSQVGRYFEMLLE